MTRSQSSSQVKLNLLMLEGIEDDVDFCLKLAKEESVIVLPGIRIMIRGFYIFVAIVGCRINDRMLVFFLCCLDVLWAVGRYLLLGLPSNLSVLTKASTRLSNIS